MALSKTAPEMVLHGAVMASAQKWLLSQREAKGEK